MTFERETEIISHIIIYSRSQSNPINPQLLKFKILLMISVYHSVSISEKLFTTLEILSVFKDVQRTLISFKSLPPVSDTRLQIMPEYPKLKSIKLSGFSGTII